MRALLRRAGHEVRNAQSAASVNIEVVRSRAASGTGDAASLLPFAENAAGGLDESARLAESMMALCSALTLSLASGNPLSAVRTPSGTEVEIRMSRDSVVQLISGVGYLAKRIGLGVEGSDAGVILRIPPDHETDRA
jgi:hypothetical protein